MDKRIKDLAIQAGVFDEQDDDGTRFIAIPESRFTKFAQLIAKECADHIMTSSDRYRKEHFADKILTLFSINVDHDWIIKKVPNTKDEYYVESGTPPKHVLAAYGITQ